MTHVHVVPDPAAAAVLDIGDDTGALVLLVPAVWSGREVEVARLDDGWRTHTAVHPRRVGRVVGGIGERGEGTVHAGLFAALPSGPYEILLGPAGDPTNPRLTVVGGRVAEYDARRSAG